MARGWAKLPRELSKLPSREVSIIGNSWSSSEKKGFFLEDLFHERGKDANEAAPSKLSEAVKRLVAFIAANRPRVIIAVMCRICECVKATSIMSKTDASTLCLPFPRGQKYQDYVSGLSEVLLSLQRGSLAEPKVRCSPEANSMARKYCSKIMKEL